MNRMNKLLSLQENLINQLFLLYDCGKFELVSEISSDLIKSFPNSDILLNLIGLSNRELKNYNISENAFKRLTKIQPNYPDGFNNLGAVLLDQRKTKEAKKCFERAIFLNKNYAEAYNNYGNVFIKEGEFDKAIPQIKKAINLNPNYFQAYLNLGNAFYQNKKFEYAIKSYKKALEISPNLIDAIYNIGNCFIGLGELKKGLVEFKKILSRYPKNLKSKYKIATIYQDTGKIESALSLFIEILSDESKTFEMESNIFNSLFFSLFAIKNNKPKFYKSIIKHLEALYLKKNKTDLAILKYRLNKGSIQINKYYDEFIEKISKENYHKISNDNFAETDSNQQNNKPKKIIALFQTGRAGTGLLHSLIDGHSEIITLPSSYFSEYFDIKIWKNIIKDGWSKIVDNFIKNYPILFNANSSAAVSTIDGYIKDLGKSEGLCNMGKLKNETLLINKLSFKKELTSLIHKEKHLNALSFFKLVHIAYEKALINETKKNIIFYHIHNPDTYSQLNFNRLAKSSKFILMVREPLQSCESWIKHAFNHDDYNTVVGGIYQMLFEIDNIIFSKKPTIGIRLEDLKKDPLNTIKSLCKYIGIKEEKSLYEMTFQNKIWWGEKLVYEIKSGKPDPFDKKAINKKIGEIFSLNDQFIFETLFYPFRKKFGYVEKNDRKFLKDLKKIRQMIDDIFDFEKKFIEINKKNKDDFIKSCSYKFLREVLKERWSTLNKFQTYPNLINPLKIK